MGCVRRQWLHFLYMGLGPLAIMNLVATPAAFHDNPLVVADHTPIWMWALGLSVLYWWCCVAWAVALLAITLFLAALLILAIPARYIKAAQ